MTVSLYEFFKIKLQLLLDSLIYLMLRAWLLSGFQLFATPGTIALQAPLSVGFSRQEYWSGLPFPSLGGLPDPVIQPLPWVSVLLSLSLASEAEEENHAICACGPQRTVFWPTAHCLSAVPLSALSTALLYPNPSGTTFTCITTCLLRHHGAQRHPWLPPQPALPPSLLPSRPHQEPASSSQPL